MQIVQLLQMIGFSRNCENRLVLGGVLSLVIPTLHINLSRGLRFIECKSVFHNFIYSCIKATPVSLSFHVKESNK